MGGLLWSTFGNNISASMQPAVWDPRLREGKTLDQFEEQVFFGSARLGKISVGFRAAQPPGTIEFGNRRILHSLLCMASDRGIEVMGPWRF